MADDDITPAERTLAEHFGDETAAEVVAALAGAGLEVRARVGGTDGPDQGDPAAWLVKGPHMPRPTVTLDREDADDALRRDDTRTKHALYLRAPGAVTAAPESGEEQDAQIEALDADLRSCLGDPDGDMIHTVAEGLHALGYRRGAVATAPPGDEDPVLALEAARVVAARQGYTVVLTAVALHVANIAESTGERNSSIWTLRGAAKAAAAQRRDQRARGALVPPAPLAGHEDEAPVRARVRTAVWGLIGWGVDTMKAPDAVEAVTDAALAAARGPRTPDPGAGA